MALRLCLTSAAILLAAPFAHAQKIGPNLPPQTNKAPHESEHFLEDTKVLLEEILETDSSISLQSILEYTYLNNPDLQAARAGLQATKEALPQARAGWRPTITADAGINSVDITGSNFGSAKGSTAKNYGLSLNQPIFRGGRTLAQTDAAHHVIAAQLARLHETEQNILLQAATAYLNVLRDQALLDLAENNLELLSEQLRATENRFEFGELTKTDVSQAQSRVAGAESNIVSANSDLQTSEAIFWEVIGRNPTSIYKPKFDLFSPGTLSDAVRIAEENNPLITVARNVHLAAEKDIDDVFGELLPQISLASSWARTHDPVPGLVKEDTTRSIGLSASIPLYQGGGTRSRVREAKHIANQREIEITAIKRQVRRLVTEDWENLQAAKGEIKSREAQVAATTVAEEGVTQEAEVGARTILDVLDATQERLDAQVALVTAERDEIVAHFSLLQSMGLLTPETLKMSQETIIYKDSLRRY